MKFYIVDCFAEGKYQGNELLVVKADRPVTDEEQQKIAREINFSETAFILSDKQADGGYDVRIWTPNVGEVPFAGHPTLGTAHVIRHCYEGGGNDSVKLNLKVGQIPIAVTEDGMTMSQNPPVFGDIMQKQEIAEVFGISTEDIDEKYPVQWVSTGLEAVIVPLKSRRALSEIKMDRPAFEKYIERHPKNYCNHLFFVGMGNNTLAARCMMEDYVEDPATGSANGDLAGYLLKHNWFGIQDIRYTVVQGEDMGRKSILHVHASRKYEDWIIEVGGNCYIVAEGEWR
ncbi:MAG: PhzF family phenazine biosynthesis protein [Hornefia butyriciproducens]|uniref:PhzF family phenazine biosynthesis protein n=1 Tax=Hornefia butyriciproducens TaxID=2652293 RepID=UPI002A7525C4|nr:PhzF family phenazine biosynthesis protein [Hornefia butyriciproducens]MCI7327664.1 PhzF family phenazine biosynthesis protein [Clostridiales bacterium]MDY2990720.1 PhzF family phenazine biosynthesis protein [Hornefia butyriciproducens]